MIPHDRVLVRGKVRGLIENGQGNASFSDVVQRRRHAKPFHVRTGESNIQSKSDRHACYQKAVLEGALMVPPNVIKPSCQAILLDGADDLRCGIFRVRKI